MLFITFPSWSITQLSLWHSWKENQALWLKIAQEFNNSHPNIKLKVSAFDHEEMKLAIIKSGFKLKSTDMVVMPSDWLGYQNLMQFSAIPKEVINKNVNANILKQSYFYGKIRGIPLFQGNHLLFMYNKSLVKTPVISWQELIDQKEFWLKQKITPLAINYNEMYWFLPFISAFGGFPVHGDKITLNTPETIKALQFYKYLADISVVNKQCNYQCVSTDFYQGKFAYSMAGAWAYKAAKNALGDKLGIALFPKLKQHDFKPLRGNLILAFPKNKFNGLKHDALLKFSRFIQQQKYQQIMFEQGTVFPVNDTVMNNILTHANSDLKLSFKQFNQSDNMPASTSITAIWNGMGKGFSLYMHDQLNAADAVKYMQRSVEHQQELLDRKFD